MSQLKKQGLALLAGILLLCSGVWADSLPNPPSSGYVLDEANVISAETETKISDLSEELYQDCDAQIYVMTTDFTGNENIEDYAHDLYNTWGVGRDGRGALLVFAVGAEDYYCALGDDLDVRLTAGTLSDLLQEDLEPDFAKQNYEEGTLRFVKSLSKEISRVYNGSSTSSALNPQREEHQKARMNVNMMMVIALLIVILVIVKVRWRGRGFRRSYSSTSTSFSSYGSGGRSYSRSSSRSSRASSSHSSSRSYSRPGGGSSRGSGAGRRSGGGRRR